MNRTYRLAVFDADGTVFDSAPGIFASIRHTAEVLGLPEISESQMCTHLGPPVDVAYRRSFGLEGDRLEEAVRIHRAFNTEHGVNMCRVYGGIRDVLTELGSDGIMTAVASLKPSETLERLIDITGIGFDSVHGRTDRKESKADLIRACLEDLGVEPADAVMIGDTETDREGAALIGTDFIPVSYGYGFKKDEHTADSAEDIIRIIRGRSRS